MGRKVVQQTGTNVCGSPQTPASACRINAPLVMLASNTGQHLIPEA